MCKCQMEVEALSKFEFKIFLGGNHMKHISYDCIKISAFSEGMAAIITNEGVGFINTNGELVIPTVFEHVDHMTMTNTHYMFKEGLSSFVKGGKCGYIDKKGDIVISSEYDSASPFNEGIAAVSKEGKWGAIDKNGKVVIPIEYDFVQPSSEGVCGVFKDNRRGYIDILGNNVIPLNDKYDIVHPFKCETAVVMVGKWKIPTVERCANESDNDYLNRYRDEVEKITQNNFFGAINKKGELTIGLKYKFLSAFSEDLAAASIDGKKLYINTSGETVLDLSQYDLIGAFSEGLACVKSDKKWGCIDKSGRLIIPTEYDNMLMFENQYAPISKDSKWGLIDKDGTIRLPNEYDFVSSVENGYAIVNKGDLWSIVSIK